MASEVSQTRRAIVIATEATVASHAYRDALARHGVESFEKACPLFVPLVEEGWTEHSVTEQVAQIYLGEAIGQTGEQADVLVLACTHYPLIAPLLRRITPAQMKIVDSAESTARMVKKMIAGDGQSSGVILSEVRHQSSEVDGPLSEAPTHAGAPFSSPSVGERVGTKGPNHRSFRFYVTDSVDKFKKLATRFLGRQVDHVEHVDLGG